MSPQLQHLAAAFFGKSSDAQNAIAELRQAGFAQIGVASHDDNQERQLAEKTETKPGMATSANVGTLERTDEESDYASIMDVHGTLLAANLSEHQASNYRDRLEHNGVLVTVQAPADRWQQARRTLVECGGDSAAENPATSGSGRSTLPREAETTTVVTPVPPAPIEPPPRQPAPKVESTIPNPGQQGTVVKREPGTPQSEFDLSRGMGPVELRGTLLEAHRQRLAGKAARLGTESDAEHERHQKKIA
ncbi:MAG: hypothetical protein ACRD04_08460 [Terriglobales bacterium]